MKVNPYYANSFENRYRLNVSYWKAFMNFFGFYPNLYDDAINYIANKTTREALMSDVSAIRQDGCKVIVEHKLDDIKDAKVKYAAE